MITPYFIHSTQTIVECVDDASSIQKLCLSHNLAPPLIYPMFIYCLFFKQQEMCIMQVYRDVAAKEDISTELVQNTREFTTGCSHVRRR